jgi:hypothetical protein
MGKSSTKKASGPKKIIKKEASSSRPRRTRETIKQVIVLSDSDEIDSDYAEFLKTYDPEEDYSDSKFQKAILSDSSTAEESEVLKKEETKPKKDVKSK